VLSLDYRAGRFMGAAEIERRVALWPDRLILMTLDRVGMDKGPDLAALEALIRRAEGRAVFAAGGVRDESDLQALERIGAAGVLVASALHDGRLSASVLARFAG
jgi:phosphoribosylformimino-5-aminoimidazole carboxamide ribotide isomerase